MNTVLVIGCHLSGLGVIRALGRHGLNIVALSYESTDMGTASRYVSEKHRVPHPSSEEKAFVQYLVDNSIRWTGALIFDCDDHVAVCLSRNKDLLSKYYRIITEDWDILSWFIDKSKTYQLAQRCDVLHPKTFMPRSMEDLATIQSRINYPCLLKPIRGHDFKSRFNKKAFKISTVDELKEKFHLCLQARVGMLVQELIPGADSEIYKMQTYINSRGKMTGNFFYRKLRQNPPQFGVGRVAVSTERDAEVENLSTRILAESGFKGICNLEFKKDERDGRLKLLEVNIRMSRINWLPTFCGINYPWIIYMDLVKNEQISIVDYRKNVYLIDLFADILNSIFRNNQEDITLREYVRPYFAKDKTFADLSLDDIKPFFKHAMALPKIYKRFRNSKGHKPVEHLIPREDGDATIPTLDGKATKDVPTAGCRDTNLE